MGGGWGRRTIVVHHSMIVPGEPFALPFVMGEGAIETHRGVGVTARYLSARVVDARRWRGRNWLAVH